MNNYLILVNKNNRFIDNNLFVLKKYINRFNEEFMVEDKTLKSFLKLQNDLKDKNIEIDIDSAYRTINYQDKLYDEIAKDKGLDYAKKYVSKSGYSEHHTGLAIDIILVKNGTVLDDSELYDNEDILYIHEILYKYGFILRYPEGKENITGYYYEPWHFRYIDSNDIAKYIYEHHLCLEEYLEN